MGGAGAIISVMAQAEVAHAVPGASQHETLKGSTASFSKHTLKALDGVFDLRPWTRSRHIEHKVGSRGTLHVLNRLVLP